MSSWHVSARLKESLYMLLFKKREENALMLASAATPTKTIDIPRADPETSGPKPLKIIVICLFLGLMLPAGLLYLYVLLDNKIRDPKEFEKRLKVPYLGQIVANSRGKHIAIREGESTVSAEFVPTTAYQPALCRAVGCEEPCGARHLIRQW